MHEIDASRDMERTRRLPINDELKTRLLEEDETVTREEVDLARRLAEDAGGDASPKSAKRVAGFARFAAELERRRLLTDGEYRGLQKLMETIVRKRARISTNLFEAGIGAEAVEKCAMILILNRIARVEKERGRNGGGRQARALIKRLEIVESVS